MSDEPDDEDDLDRERQRWRDRKRASRERECLGLEQYKMDLPRDKLIEAMLNSQRMSEAEALDHAKVEEEIAKIMDQWIERWEK